MSEDYIVMKLVLEIKVSYIKPVTYINVLIICPLKLDSRTIIGKCVRSSPTDDLNCFVLSCPFANASLEQIEDHFRTKHYNNKNIYIEVLLFFSTFREGTLPKSTDFEDNICLDNKEGFQGEENRRGAEIKRQRETELEKDDRDEYLSGKWKHKKIGSDSIEHEDIKDPEPSLPPPNQTLYLKTYKPLRHHSYGRLDKQPHKRLNSDVKDNIKSDDIESSDQDDIDSEDIEDDEPDNSGLSLPHPNQLHLHRPRPLLLQKNLHSIGRNNQTLNLEQRVDEERSLNASQACHEKRFIFTAFKKLTHTERKALLEIPLEDLVDELKFLASKKH